MGSYDSLPPSAHQVISPIPGLSLSFLSASAVSCLSPSARVLFYRFPSHPDPLRVFKFWLCLTHFYCFVRGFSSLRCRPDSPWSGDDGGPIRFPSPLPCPGCFCVYASRFCPGPGFTCIFSFFIPLPIVTISLGFAGPCLGVFLRFFWFPVFGSFPFLPLNFLPLFLALSVCGWRIIPVLSF